MTQQRSIPVTCLGQSGFRFEFGNTVVYVDPYLSNRVAELEGDDLARQVPIYTDPAAVADAHWVLVTHAHLDHCDLATLIPVAAASRRARFMCPNEVAPILREAGLDGRRLEIGREQWIVLAPDLLVHPVPAAHPKSERDSQGLFKCLGYLLEWQGRRLYHSGDTSLDEEVVSSVKEFAPIDVAFLPVNERNFYRERRGIIGNMTLREAFGFAAELGVKTLIPMHWDMFAPNSVYPEEITLLYDLVRPPFQMVLRPDRV